MPRARRPRSRQVAGFVALLAVWAVTAGLTAAALFLSSSRSIVVASHDTVVRPTLSREVVVRTGPVLPDVRIPSGLPIGLDLALGKTEATSTAELIRRYAFIASRPEGQVASVLRAVREMAWAAALRGGAMGLAPVLVWLLLGRARRAELRRRLRSPVGAAVVVGLAGLVVVVWQPWQDGEWVVEDDATWVGLADFVGPVVPLPPEAARVEVRTDVTTTQSRRLVLSAVDTYRQSKDWYARAAAAAADLELRRPADGETVALLVSDRHDNIGMDAVARALADAGGATAVLDAGDDTSTGKSWEAFSLDSLDEAFDDVDRYAVAGNHDHGPFVSDYLVDRGWVNPDGEVVEGPGESWLLGTDDPRSSGLGNWRDESGLSFSEHADRIADAACASSRRVGTLLVHDVNSGGPALERGCVDLVVGGHLHVQRGPTAVAGDNGAVGYSYTNGTTGGAAYAIAVGSKPRRAAEVTLVTYRDGRPVGVQPVTLQTDGSFQVGGYVGLSLRDPTS